MTAAERRRAKKHLTDARSVLVEHGWTKYFYAKDGRGSYVKPDNPSAVEFCVVGALMRANRHAKQHAYFTLLNTVGDRFVTLSEWNDKQRSVKPVLAAIDRAIANLEAEV